MLKLSLLATALLSIATAAAQQTAEPKFQGADVQRFLSRLVGEMKKMAVEAEEYPADGLSDETIIRGEVDTAGVFRIIRFLDDACEGRDFRNIPPATPYTRELTVQAAGRLERWTPAVDAQGCSVVFPLTFRLRLPVRQILAERDLKEGTPLLFDGDDPRTTFGAWLDARIGNLGAGEYHVKIYIEPDGSVGDIVVGEKPSEKEGQKLMRIIRTGKNKWTPKKLNGTPIRAFFEYRLHMQTSFE